MKTPIAKRIAAASLGVLVSLSALAGAMHHGGGAAHDPGPMLIRMAERLDLTDEQRAQVRALVDEGREEAATDRARLQELRDQLHAMRDDFDPGRAQKIADEIGEITGRMAYRFASTHARFYGLLTEEQKAELAQLQEQREEHREERRDRWHQQPPESRN